MKHKNVLVTGAGGFVGRAVCDILVRRGYAVSAAARDVLNLPDTVRPRKIGDIGPDTDWVDAVFATDAVIHLAARVHVMNETAKDALAQNRRINTEGTRALAEAAAAAGVRRFVFVSTVKVLGETTGIRPFMDMDPPRPPDPYAQSKWEAERALWAIAEKTGMEVVILRPPLVYGPGVKGNVRTLLDRLARGGALPLPLAGIHNRRSMLYVGNLADAIALCLEHPRAAGQTYLIRDGEDLSTPDLIRRIDAAVKRPSNLMALPPVLLRLAAMAVGRGAAAERLTGSLAVDDSRIRDDLDWHPPFTVTQGLEETVLWHRDLLAGTRSSIPAHIRPSERKR
ncbi:MAG: NAD-dependent epimerase/dehydratase family protein [Alphaproteobacteria bacterium]